MSAWQYLHISGIVAFVNIQFFNGIDIGFVDFEIENVEILCQTFLVGRLWDDDLSFLDLVTKQDLSW